MASDVVSRVTAVVAVVDKATGPIRAIQAQLGRLSSAASRVTDHLRAFAAGTGLSKLPGLLDGIASHAIDAGRELFHMLLPVLGLSAGGATIAGLVDLGEGLKRFVEQGARLNVVSTRIGTTIEQLQNLEYAAALVEVPTDVLDTNLGRLNRTLAQVAVGKNKEATKLLGFVGIAARDARGHIKSAADVMPQLADVFAKVHNPAQRARLAVALFGKGGQALIPVLAQGSRGLAAASRDMAQLGRMTKQETEEAHELHVAQLRLGVAFNRIQEIIGAALAPYTKKAVDAMREWIVTNRVWLTGRIHYWIDRGATAVKNWWTQLKAVDWHPWLDGLKDTAQWLRRWFERLGGLNGVLRIFIAYLVADTVLNFGRALYYVAGAIKAISIAMYANPYLAAGAALIGFAILVYTYWNKITHWLRYYSKVIAKEGPYYFHQLEDSIARTMDTIRDTVQHELRAIANAFKRTWNEIARNPLTQILSPVLGFGFGGLPTFATPPQNGGAGRPPAAPQPGPYRSGYRFPGGPTGSVDVNVNLEGAPQGTRTNTKTRGSGLRANTRVGYSMPHVQRAFA